MGGTPADTADCVPVQIHNNYSLSHSVEAFVLVSGSPPRRLGRLRPGARETFLFRPRSQGSSHQLYVSFLGLDWEITSVDFTPNPDQILVWELGANMLSWQDRPEEVPGRCR